MGGYLLTTYYVTGIILQGKHLERKDIFFPGATFMKMDVKVVVENWTERICSRQIGSFSSKNGRGGGVVVNFFQHKKSINTTALTVKQSMHPLDVVWVNWAGEPVAKADNLAIVIKSV